MGMYEARLAEGTGREPCPQDSQTADEKAADPTAVLVRQQQFRRLNQARTRAIAKMHGTAFSSDTSAALAAKPAHRRGLHQQHERRRLSSADTTYASSKLQHSQPRLIHSALSHHQVASPGAIPRTASQPVVPTTPPNAPPSLRRPFIPSQQIDLLQGSFSQSMPLVPPPGSPHLTQRIAFEAPAATLAPRGRPLLGSSLPNQSKSQLAGHHISDAGRHLEGWDYLEELSSDDEAELDNLAMHRYDMPIHYHRGHPPATKQYNSTAPFTEPTTNTRPKSTSAIGPPMFSVSTSSSSGTQSGRPTSNTQPIALSKDDMSLSSPSRNPVHISMHAASASNPSGFQSKEVRNALVEVRHRNSRASKRSHVDKPAIAIVNEMEQAMWMNARSVKHTPQVWGGPKGTSSRYKFGTQAGESQGSYYVQRPKFSRKAGGKGDFSMSTDEYVSKLHLKPRPWSGLDFFGAHSEFGMYFDDDDDGIPPLTMH